MCIRCVSTGYEMHPLGGWRRCGAGCPAVRPLYAGTLHGPVTAKTLAGLSGMTIVEVYAALNAVSQTPRPAAVAR